VGVLLPALTRARAQANSIKCLSNLRTISQALFNYTADNRGWVIPSFNLPRIPGSSTNYTSIGPAQAMDGWAAILDRDGYCHPGPSGANTIANVGFADGQAEPIDGRYFPQSKSASNPNAATENLTGPTIYANPEAIFGG
jgi:hypothetical protein